MKRISFFILLTGWFVTIAYGADVTPVDNGYPYFITTSMYPQDKGLLEYVIQPMYVDFTKQSAFIFYPQVAYGITDNWQVFMGTIPYVIAWPKNRPRTQGNGDTNIGTEYSWIYIDKTNCSAAVIFNMIIPTGDINKNLTDGLMHYTPSFIVAKDFIHGKWRTQLFSEVGISFVQRVKSHTDPRLNSPSAHYLIYNGGIAERSENINYSLEFSWITNTWNNQGTDNQMYITPGIYYKVRKDVAIGLGVPVGLNKTSAHYQVIANLLVDIETIFSKKKTSEEKSTEKTPLSHHLGSGKKVSTRLEHEGKSLLRNSHLQKNFPVKRGRF